MTKNNPNLSDQQKKVLFEEATEAPGSSELNFEKREGSYYCANCETKLFDSNTKYESGSGWPSFYESIPDVFETKTDHHIGYAGLNITVKNVAVTMGIFLMMGHSQLVKDIVITGFA